MVEPKRETCENEDEKGRMFIFFVGSRFGCV